MKQWPCLCISAMHKSNVCYRHSSAYPMYPLRYLANWGDWCDVRTSLRERHIFSILYSGSSDIANGDEHIIEYVLRAISLYIRTWGTSGYDLGPSVAPAVISHRHTTTQLFQCNMHARTHGLITIFQFEENRTVGLSQLYLDCMTFFVDFVDKVLF